MFALCVLGICCTDAAEPELLKYLPAGTEYVIALDVDQLRKLPAAQEEGGSLENYGAAFEDRYQLKLEDCRSLLFVGGGKRLRGVLIDLLKPENELVALLKDHGRTYEKSFVRKHTVHLVADETLVSFGASKIGLSYLDSRSVLATEQEYLAPFFDGLQANEASRRAAVSVPEGEPLAWGFCNVAAVTAKKKSKGKKAGVADSFLQNIRTVGAKLDYVGENDVCWQLQAVALCTDAKSAEMMRSALPGYLMLMTNLLMAKEPELGMELLKTMKFSAHGNKLSLDVKISAGLAGRLETFFSAGAAQLILSPDPVPADMPQRRKPATVTKP